MNDYQPELVCADCDHPAGLLDWRCAQCGGPLNIANMPAFDPDGIDENDWSLWRYRALLPVTRRFSLGEGLTPLVPVELADGAIHAKLEYLNPTGSYKDRGTATLVNRLLAEGVRAVVEDSSGNAGASLAAYAGPTDIHARVFVSAHASAAKKRLIAINAELVEVAGVRSAATDACHKAAQESVYASHAWSPFFLAGQMTCAWEVWEQLGKRAPDAIACPVGHGGLFLGFARGFKMLRAAGLVEQMPRLFAVQAAACDPVVRAWENGLEKPDRIEDHETVADGIVVVAPVRGKEILSVIRESNGAALRVEDDAILAARDSLAQRGLFAEPTSAVPIAALKHIREQLGPDAEVVIPLTGSGLKGP